MVIEGELTTAAGRRIPVVFQTLDAKPGTLPAAAGASGWLAPITDLLRVPVGPGPGRVLFLRAQRLIEHLDPGDTVETNTLVVAIPPGATSIADLRIYLHVDAQTSTKPLYEARAATGAWRALGSVVVGTIAADLEQVAPAGEAGGLARLDGRFLLQR